MVDGDGTIRLIDFGTVRRLDGDQHEPARSVGLTEPGTVIGTAEYMPPEAGVSREGDQYELGCTAYELLTGVSPYRSFRLGQQMQYVKWSGAVTPMRALAPTVSPEIAQVISRAMSPSRTARHESVSEFASALAAAAGIDAELVTAPDASEARTRVIADSLRCPAEPGDAPRHRAPVSVARGDRHADHVVRKRAPAAPSTCAERRARFLSSARVAAHNMGSTGVVRARGAVPRRPAPRDRCDDRGRARVRARAGRARRRDERRAAMAPPLAAGEVPSPDRGSIRGHRIPWSASITRPGSASGSRG